MHTLDPTPFASYAMMGLQTLVFSRGFPEDAKDKGESFKLLRVPPRLVKYSSLFGPDPL